MLGVLGCALLGSDDARADWRSLERTLAEEPNVSDVAGAFHGGAVSGRVAKVENGLLACRLSADASEAWDAFRGPDLLLRMRFGADRERWRAADCNGYVGIVSVPGVQLGVGQRVSARLEDRDPLGNELITTLTTAWDGTLPLRLRGEHGAVECRLVPSSVVARHSEALAADLARGISALRRARFRPEHDALGRPTQRAWSAESDLASLSAWRGRDHADVLAARAELEAALAAVEERIREGLRDHLAGLPAAATWTALGPLSVRARELDCDDGPAATCFVVLALRNDGERRLQVARSPWLATALVVESVQRDGAVTRLSLASDAVSLAAGASTSLRVPLAAGYRGAPVALRVTRGGSRAWLRVP